MNKKRIFSVVLNRGTATYRNGKLDFTYGEGGNHHIHAYDTEGNEIGYIWFDNHCTGKFGFCGRGVSSCNGVFADALAAVCPDEWGRDDYIFRFYTEEMFNAMMEAVIAAIR